MNERYDLPEELTPEEEIVVDELGTTNPEVAPKKQSILSKALKRIGIAGALLTTLSQRVEAQKKPAEDIFSKESLSKVTRKYKSERPVAGDRYTGVTDVDDVFALETKSGGQDVSYAIQHNLEKPESLAEFSKMLIEPVSISFSFPYGKDNLVAIIRTKLGYGEKETQIVDVEIPYKYAEQFDKADPKDKEKMKEQAMEDAEKLFEEILTNVFGPSFFKKDAEEHHREFSTPITEVSAMDVEGFASPESTKGINLKDVRNQKLSKLRAENASETIRELFKEKNIGVEEITFHGGGEVALDDEELKKLANEAVQLDLSNPNDKQGVKVLEIIEKYNDGSITEESAKELLDEIVGSKRKVAIHLEIDKEKKILVLPIPLLLSVGWGIKKILNTYEWWRNRGGKYLPHSFIRSQDPKKPTEEVPRIKDNVFEYVNIEKVVLEANEFFSHYKFPYPGGYSFFMVSSDDKNDLETADVYRRVAQQRGFKVIKPEHTRNDSEDITHGYVRVINSLNVDPEKSQEELYNHEFKNLIRLLDFGENKIKEGEEDPSQGLIKILAFGQDNTVQHALNKYFKERYPLRNLEVISLGGTKNPEKAKASYRGKTRKIK